MLSTDDLTLMAESSPWDRLWVLESLQDLLYKLSQDKVARCEARIFD